MIIKILKVFEICNFSNDMNKEIKLKRGIFSISIDYELAWGYADRELTEGLKVVIKKEPAIVKRLIELFEKYNIPATWAIAGQLLESRSDNNSELWSDIYKLIPLIKQARANHEIGSHSYSHIIYGDKNINPRAVREDISQAQSIHEKYGLPFNSFIFPRNKEGYHELLKQAGIVCFRGNSQQWFEKMPLLLKRLGHLSDYFLPGATTFLPSQHKSGLINIPDSLLFLSREGVRQLIYPAIMKRKILTGLKKARKKKEIFHLWFHPYNFVFQAETQFAILERILREANYLRKKDKINILTLNKIANLYRYGEKKS